MIVVIFTRLIVSEELSSVSTIVHKSPGDYPRLTQGTKGPAPPHCNLGASYQQCSIYQFLDGYDQTSWLNQANILNPQHINVLFHDWHCTALQRTSSTTLVLQKPSNDIGGTSRTFRISSPTSAT